MGFFFCLVFALPVCASVCLFVPRGHLLGND